MKILIADDSAVVRRGITRILNSRREWRVCAEAENGGDALRKIDETQPEVILLDISMPGVDGLETARAIRRQWPQIKIVIMSSNDVEQLVLQTREAGADACIDKASLASELIPTIAGL